MRLTCDLGFGEVDLKGAAEELNRLAGAVAEGSDALAGIVVERTAGPGVLVHLDSERRFLVISGDSAGRAVLADNLRGIASAEDGGHLHIDYFPGHAEPLRSVRHALGLM